MYWIIVVLGKYGGLHPVLSLIILFALCLYLALYPGLFGVLFYFLRDSKFRVLLLAGAWVCLEYLRGRLFTGLPWCLIGHSQAARLHLIQVCDLLGVYGLSYLIAAVNILIFETIFDRRPAMRTERVAQTALVTALLLLTAYYGGLELRGASTTEPIPIRTAVVQGNIDQSEKWIPEFQEKTVASYLRLSRQAARTEPDLIVWPETAVPLFFQDPSPLSARIIDIPEQTGADLLFGSPAYVHLGHEVHYTNRAYLLSSNDRAILTYDKTHLVPFGEYVPLQRFLPFVSRLVPAAGDFVPGEKISPLPAGAYTAGVLICYEAIFSHLARSQVKGGADILVNLTNDAWFGRTSAPFQHLSMSVFRAVETRRPLIRAANTGISAFVDSKGRIIRQGDLFREAVIVSDVIPSRQGLTFYVRYGYLFPLFLLLVICGILINSKTHRLFRRSSTGC